MTDSIKHYLQRGWQAACRQPFAVGAWFVCHCVWSILLYRDVQERVAAVMSRFPSRDMPGERAELFLNETITLLYTDGLARPLLTALALFAVAQLVIAPFIQAGVYASIHRAQGPRGTTFVQGLRQNGLAFVVIALLRTTLTVLPLYWLLPAAWRAILGAESYAAIAGAVLPLVAAFMLYSAFIRQLFMYVQFGKTANASLLRSLYVALRYVLPISALALILFAVALLLGTAVYALSLFTAGLIALILYLAFPLLHIVLKLWGVAVHYHFWQDKTR